MNKDFAGWSALKTFLHGRQETPLFEQREIWWCSIGVNIGFEADGKSERFNRPVLIIRKFNRHIFFGVPLTTQLKENPYYYRFEFHGKMQCAMISQLRLWEAKRLTKRIGKLPTPVFEDIRQAIKNLI